MLFRSDCAHALVQALGAEVGVRAFLHGPAFDAPQRMGGFDIALVLGEHQGCPNAVLEAMAAGLPVVANDSGGTRELVVDGRTGVLLPDRDPARVAQALRTLMADAALAARLGDAGRRHVAARFSMAGMAQAYAGLFDELSRERSHAQA